MLVALLALGLSGCASQFKRPSAPLPCPRVKILDLAREVVRVRPGSSGTPADVTMRATFSKLSFECEYDTNDEGPFVRVPMRLEIVAQAGPVGEHGSVTLPYFVAIGDPFGNIVTKKLFKVELDLSGGEDRAVEELDQVIPLRTFDEGAGYAVFIGFQMSEEEFERARARRRG